MTKIKLTEEQIAILIKDEKEKLQAAYNSDVEKLKRKFEKDIAGLTEKFVYFDFSAISTRKTRTAFDETKITGLYLEEKSVKEIATALNYPLPSTQAKISRMIKDGKLKKRKK